MSVIEMNHAVAYTVDGSEREYAVLLKLYTDSADIVDAYMGGENSVTMHGVSESRKVDRETVLSEVNGIGVWGWSEMSSDGNVIHFWVDKGVNPESIREELTAMLAHEQGHLCRPFYKNMNAEEKKAMDYENVTTLANSVANDVLQAVHFNGLTALSDDDLVYNMLLYARKAGQNFKRGSVDGIAPLLAMAREMWRRGDQC